MSRSETAIQKNAGTPPAPDGGDVFKIESLTMAYGDYVVMRDLDFSVKRGEIFFIIGGSGCGKNDFCPLFHTGALGTNTA